MDYKYKGTFIISAENTRILPGKGYEVYHCDRVRSLLDEINRKGKNMYAKIQEIQFPDDLDWSVRFTEWAPGYIRLKDTDKFSQLTNTVTAMEEIGLPDDAVGPPQFLQDWIPYWSSTFDQIALDGSRAGGVMKLEFNEQSKRMGLLYYYEDDDAVSDTFPAAQYHVEFGTGLQYRFGLPAMIGRNIGPMLESYPEEPPYRAQNEGESAANYQAYKTKAKADWEKWIDGEKELKSRVMGHNVRLERHTIPDEFPACRDAVKNLKITAFDFWIFEGGIVKRDQAVTQPPHYLYFSHADLCGPSLNLQRSTCLVDYPQGTVYDARDEYIYVHNCSPFPNITFTAYTPKAIGSDGAIEYEKYLYYPQQFYVIIDYYEG